MSATESRRGVVPASTVSAEFGPWLRRAREGLKLTVREFSEKCGLSSGTITNFEHGHRRQGAFVIGMFERLAQGLDMDLGYVLWKAGFDLGPDGVNLSRLQRVDAVAEDFAEHHSQVRMALAEAIHEFERAGLKDDRLVMELGRGLASLDRLGERLRREGYAARRTLREDAEGRQRVWSASEMAFLRDHRNLTNEEAAGHLGRTPDAVRAQRKRINGGRA